MGFLLNPAANPGLSLSLSLTLRNKAYFNILDDFSEADSLILKEVWHVRGESVGFGAAWLNLNGLLGLSSTEGHSGYY